MLALEEQTIEIRVCAPSYVCQDCGAPGLPVLEALHRLSGGACSEPDCAQRTDRNRHDPSADYHADIRAPLGWTHVQLPVLGACDATSYAICPCCAARAAAAAGVVNSGDTPPC